jgi:hypothetical protein
MINVPKTLRFDDGSEMEVKPEDVPTADGVPRFNPLDLDDDAFLLWWNRLTPAQRQTSEPGVPQRAAQLLGKPRVGYNDCTAPGCNCDPNYGPPTVARPYDEQSLQAAWEEMRQRELDEVAEDEHARQIIAEWEKFKKPKPMRIRCMELPGEINPDTQQVSSPFVIVIDRMGDEWLEGSALTDMMGEALIEATGARGAVKFQGEVQIGDDY